MLGTACFRLCARGNHYPSTVALSHFHHSSWHAYFSQAICRHATSPNLFRSLSWPRQQAATVNTEGCSSQVSSSKRFCCHTSSYWLGGNEVSCATIWHGLLPSNHPCVFDQNVLLPSSSGFSSFDPHLGSMPTSSLNYPCKEDGRTDLADTSLGMLPLGTSDTTRGASGFNFPHGNVGGMGRLAMAAGLLDGSWNVAWDARPARWLHGRDSAWLLFGVCACFLAAEGTSVPNMLTVPQQLSSVQRNSECEAVPSIATQGKQVYTDYSVTGIRGDGRCLFRSLAHGACIRNGNAAPNESLQCELADELRNKVVDELIIRRSESEWFIEEDFDTYVKRMRDPYVWGGEPELLMASHVLKMPITVHLFDRSLGGLISIAEYGLEYGSENPIRVLYHGFGHYDAIQVPESGTHSRL